MSSQATTAAAMAASATTIDIEPADVIRLIEQYLKENNLFKTLQSLQDETSVSLNTVDSVETFVNDIQSGHWDVVLRVVKLLKLPDAKLIDLYEQIALELIELDEKRAANWLIHRTEPIQKLKNLSPDRYLHLQAILGRSIFSHHEAYRDGGTKEQRRQAIAQALKKEVSVVPSQRLLSLLGDALKWQKHEGLLPAGSAIDIFTGKAHITRAEEETHPNTLHRHCVRPLLTLGEDGADLLVFVTCAEFSPDGYHLAVGYSSGLIEIRNANTGRMANDLKYQYQKNPIVTPSRKSALALCFGGGGSNSDPLMGIGDQAGDISVWRLETGQLLQIFTRAHLDGVSCLTFHTNGREILSGSLDKTAKLHGMRSNKTIRDFRGHRRYVMAAVFSRDEQFVITGSSDSCVKIWNIKSGQVQQEFRSAHRVHSVLLMPNFKSEIFLVGDRSSCLQLIDLEGRVRVKLQATNPETEEEKLAVKKSNRAASEADNNDNEGSNDRPPSVGTTEKSETGTTDAAANKESAGFYAACISPKGSWIYAVDRGHIYCFNYAAKRVLKRLEASGTNYELIGVKHHPYLNLLATFDSQGNLKLWKP